MILNAFARFESALKSYIRKKRRKSAIRSYMDSERRPWRLGYTEYKEELIQKAIKDPAFNRDIREGKQLPGGYGYRLDERCLEIPWVLANLETQSGRLLDAGSSLNFEYMLKSAAISKLKTTIITLWLLKNFHSQISEYLMFMTIYEIFPLRMIGLTT